MGWSGGTLAIEANYSIWHDAPIPTDTSVALPALVNGFFAAIGEMGAGAMLPLFARRRGGLDQLAYPG